MSLRARTSGQEVAVSTATVAFGFIGLGFSAGLAVLTAANRFSNWMRVSAADRIWASIDVGLLAIIGLLILWRQSRLVIVLSLAGIASLVLATVLRAGTGLAFLALGLLVVDSAALGSLALNIFAKAAAPSLLERLLLATTIGLGGLAGLTFMLGTAHWLFTPVAWSVLMVGTLLLVPEMSRVARRIAVQWGAPLADAWKTA